MSKQTFKIGNNAFPNILFWSASAALVLFGTLVLVSPTEVSTKAFVNTTEYEDGLSIATNATLNTAIHPEDSGTIVIAKDTVVGNTSSPHGYELYVSANSETINDIYLNGNTSLTETTKKIAATTATYDAPAALDITNGAAWGYAIAGLGSFDASYDETNPTASAKFAAMPVIENKQLIHEVTAAATDDETEIYYGIKADSTLEPGLYKTEILYTAVPKPAPRVAKAILGDNHNLNFVYDNLTYTVGETYTDNIGNTEIVAIYDVLVNGGGNSVVDSEQRDNVFTANFDTSFCDFRPTSTSSWFYNNSYLSSITNITNLNTSETTNAAYMFSYTGSQAQNIDMDLSGWDLGSIYDIYGIFNYFGYNSATVNLDLSGWNAPNVQYMAFAFENLATNASDFSIDVSDWTLGSLSTIEKAFGYMGRNATTWSLVGLSDWDVSTVLTTTGCFKYMGENATSFYLKIEDWNLGSATYVSEMFYHTADNATNLTMDLKGWTIGNTGSSWPDLFYYTGSNVTGTFRVDLKGWAFLGSNTTNIFYNIGCKYSSVGCDWQIDVSNWNLGNVTELVNTFSYSGQSASTWRIIGLDTWDTSKVTDMRNMFYDAGHDATTWSIGDISGWDVHNVTKMGGMFNCAGYNATTFNIGNLGFVDADHPGWNVGKVENMDMMFLSAGENATTWSIGNIVGWDINSVTSHNNFIATNANSTNLSVVNNQPNWQPQP